MNYELLVNLIGDLAWPVVAIALGFAFRHQVAGLIERMREFEGPGDTKLKFDSARIEQIVREGAKENASAELIAQRVIQQGIVDEREWRILRALLGEDHGRAMYTYQSKYYRPALDALLTKGWIRKQDKKYFLTDVGLETLRAHLQPILTAPQGP